MEASVDKGGLTDPKELNGWKVPWDPGMSTKGRGKRMPGKAWAEAKQAEDSPACPGEDEKVEHVPQDGQVAIKVKKRRKA